MLLCFLPEFFLFWDLPVRQGDGEGDVDIAGVGAGRGTATGPRLEGIFRERCDRRGPRVEVPIRVEA